MKNKIDSTCAQYSCLDPEELEILDREFRAAHADNNACISLEVGTAGGGSALLQLQALEDIYEKGKAPIFATIDPYGERPYMQSNGELFYGYGKRDSLDMKQLLCAYPNHFHFQCEFLAFVSMIPFRFWYDGERDAIEQGTLAWCFMDGEKLRSVIDLQLFAIEPLMRSGGRVLVRGFDQFEGSLRFISGAKKVEMLNKSLGLIRF